MVRNRKEDTTPPYSRCWLGDNHRLGRRALTLSNSPGKTIMTMKRTDLEKSLGQKINGKRGPTEAAGRYGAGAANVVDKRELRKQDRALGQVAFACKLPADMVKQLQTLGAAHEGGINAFVAGLISKSLPGA
jgi:hypothetical protein